MFRCNDFVNQYYWVLENVKMCAVMRVNGSILKHLDT